VAADRLRAIAARFGPSPDASSIAQAVVQEGLLDAAVEREVRYAARIAVDREQSDQIQAYVQSRGAAAPAPMMPVAPAAPPPMIRAAPAPPRFPIPDWIDTADPKVGQNLGRYRIVGRIGAGAMGVVYFAEDPEKTERPVALKVLNEQATEEAKGRFKREILANGFFSHPGAIDVWDAGQIEGGRHYLAMEFFDGQDLEQILENEPKLDPARAVSLSKQVFETLAAAHDAGIIHRDVKPSNILVSFDGATAKLMDFGIAIVRDLGEFEGQVFKSLGDGATGTPEYMSPEQASEDKLTSASDIYSMALVLYRTLSGRLPYESETAHGFMSCHMLETPLPLVKAAPATKSLPKELHALLDRAFDKTPDNRPKAREVADTLGRILPQIQAGAKEKSGIWGILWKGRGG
jgi:serine/threonine protein kinase